MSGGGEHRRWTSRGCLPFSQGPCGLFLTHCPGTTTTRRRTTKTTWWSNWDVVDAWCDENGGSGRRHELNDGEEARVRGCEFDKRVRECRELSVTACAGCAAVGGETGGSGSGQASGCVGTRVQV